MRAYVRRRISLKVALRAYQIGHAELWREWSEVVRGIGLDPPLELAVLDASSTVLFRFMDRLTTELVEAYEREQREWSRSTAAAREEAVHRLLSKEPADLEAARRDLGHDLHAVQLGVVLWTLEDHPADEALRTAWQGVTEAVPNRGATAILAGSRVLWGWLALSEGGQEAALEAFGSHRTGVAISAAAGEPAAGLEGFRLSHYQALQVRRVHGRTGGGEPCSLTLAEVAVPALLTADATLGAAFARKELGPLAEDTTVALRLCETLEVYFEEGESPAAAGRRLDVHVNTVLYRLRQAEDILGRAPSSRRLELQLALLLKRHAALG